MSSDQRLPTSPSRARKTQQKPSGKKKGAPAKTAVDVQVTTLATRHGEDAYGARFKRPGYAFTPERDLELALGYPHYIELIDEHKDDATAASRVAFVRKNLRNHYIVWPRGIATRLVRAIDKVSAADQLLKAMGKPDSAVNEQDPATPRFVHHVTDDLALVEGVIGGAKYALEEPDVRRAFIGGEAVLVADLARWKAYRGAGVQQRVIASLGSVRSPHVLPVLLEMTAKSKAKGAAIQWFESHRAFAKGFLKETARRQGSPALWAKNLLGNLG